MAHTGQDSLERAIGALHDAVDDGQTLLPEQLDALARRYRGALLSYFSRRMANSSHAEDLTQEVFVRLARHRRVDDIAHMEAYLFQTASNLLRDHARREVTHRHGDHVSLEDAGLRKSTSTKAARPWKPSSRRWWRCRHGGAKSSSCIASWA